MTIEQRKEAFILLGKFMGQFSSEGATKLENLPHNDPYFDQLQLQIEQAVHHNGWFTKENIIFSLQQWSKTLTLGNFDTWLSNYNFKEFHPKTVGLIMAGNIPLVGFHDFISVLTSGHKVLVKQSSNDNLLLPILANYMIAIDTEWQNKIEFLSENSIDGRKMKNFDAIIATGSNNTARYFQYYFGDKPSIIRKNRNSVAVLTGKETQDELRLLGEDIFRYYGLGCRNVSKLYVPYGYNFNQFFEAIYPWHTIINQAKYANNYDYNKAVYLMSLYKLLENGFLILKEDTGFGSPIATLFYEQYTSIPELKKNLKDHQEEIQCKVAKGVFKDEILLGQTQHPKLWEYADNVDTLDFLLNF